MIKPRCRIERLADDPRGGVSERGRAVIACVFSAVTLGCLLLQPDDGQAGAAERQRSSSTFPSSAALRGSGPVAICADRCGACSYALLPQCA